jgi:ceramide glucosyltransferase
VMRHMRPWGHMGLIFTQGLFWSFVAIAVHPTLPVAAAYLGAYAALRVAMTWTIGTWGLKQRGLWKQFALIPLWDALALCIWVVSFARKTVRWRGAKYYIRDGVLVPETQSAVNLSTGD